MMVDPVGDGPAAATPMPDAMPMPAIQVVMVRASHLRPSLTIGRGYRRRVLGDSLSANESAGNLQASCASRGRSLSP
jgi:hypothetical protein